MPAVNYVIYGCSSSRTTPGVITIQELHTGGKKPNSVYFVDYSLVNGIFNTWAFIHPLSWIYIE